MTVDLHIHSTYSDGTLTPAQIVDIAVQDHLKALSITDHDTIEGTIEALKRGREKNIEVIPGIEFSCVHGSAHMHLLGYYVDTGNNELAETLQSIQHAREERNHKIIVKLNKLGVDISLDEVHRKSTVGQTGRPHIAQVLMEKKLSPTSTADSHDFLRKGVLRMLGEKSSKRLQQFHLFEVQEEFPYWPIPDQLISLYRRFREFWMNLLPGDFRVLRYIIRSIARGLLQN